MDEAKFAQLMDRLAEWYGRYRRRQALLWLPRGVLGGLMIAAIIATIARFRPWLDNTQVAYTAVALALAGLAGALLWVLGQRPSPLQQARFADRLFGLRERVSTAVEIRQGSLTVPPDLAQQQLAQTLAVSESVDPRVALPLRLNRRDGLLLLVTAALLVAAILIPNPQVAALKKQRAIRRSIAEQEEALESLKSEIENNPDLDEAQKEALTAPIEEALTELDPNQSTQEEAVAVLSEAEADLRALGDELSADDLRERLETAAGSLAENESGQGLGEALQNGDLGGAGAAASQLADQLPQLSAAEQAELAQDLAETAAALSEVDGELSQQLGEAADALQRGDTAAAQDALRDAAGTLQQRNQANAAAQQAGGAAEQLNQGRGEVAQAGGEGQSETSGQTAESGEGEGSGQGQGEGSGAEEGQGGQGAGQGGQGAGSGQGQGQGEGNGSGGQQGEGTGGPGPGGGHAENVFVPDAVDLSDIEGSDVELPAECIANPELCGQLGSESPAEFGEEGSVVPYQQVYGDYRDAAYEALSEDHIPLGLKGYVRDYFSSLEP